MEDEHTRRTFLAATGATAIGIALAGCAGSTSSGGGGTPAGGTDTPAPTEGGSGDGSSGEWTETSTVEMTDELTFEPQRIQVSAGTEVTWENVGSIGHTVTAYGEEIPEGATYFASGGFDSLPAAKDGYSDGQEGNVPAGESYSHPFETTGTYEYYCIPHEMNGMVGTVKVV
ncbi:MAG: plastocyanin/azurin family copper-binding protein [Haloarculaceae archaeon]